MYKRQDENTLQREAISWYEAASMAFARGNYLDVDQDSVAHTTK